MKQGIVTGFLIFLLILGAYVVGFVGWGSPAPFHPNVPLGQWNNFPLSSQCSTGNYTAPVCEMIGNTTYRSVLIVNAADAQVQVGISVGCVIPSNTVGAFLQLQYANYSLVNHKNSTNFVNINNALLIDNSANNPCPGNIAQNPAAILPSFGGGGYIFRVVGSAGGGSGDNPRFSTVNVLISQAGLVKTPVFVPISITTTGFTALMRVSYPLAISTTEGFQWIATNVTATSCVSLAVCIQHGSGSCTAAVNSGGCTSAVTFANAFSAAPNVVGSGTSTGVSYTFPIGALNLLTAQTMTV